MAEEEPVRGGEEREPTKVPLTGPNVTSTFDLPLRADAVKAQKAAIRKHLQDRRSPHDPPKQ